MLPFEDTTDTNISNNTNRAISHASLKLKHNLTINSMEYQRDFRLFILIPILLHVANRSRSVRARSFKTRFKRFYQRLNWMLAVFTHTIQTTIAFDHNWMLDVGCICLCAKHLQMNISMVHTVIIPFTKIANVIN